MVTGMTGDDIQYIETDAALAAFCRALAGSEFVALDTEFIREKTYYPKLCLIQAADRDHIACIDPFAVKDFAPLLEVFANEAITKVMHSAQQDMEVFFQTLGGLPRPVYDTQIAASLTGLGERAAYAKLVQAMLNVKLDKLHTRTNWAQRPLDPAQIKYAADDVRYLARLYPAQRQTLRAQSRLEWLREDFAALTEPERYRPQPDTAWTRVRGHARLRGVDGAILKQLARYREQKAIAYNRPRRFVLKDEQLLEVVKLKPKNEQDMEKQRGLQSAVKRHGAALLECVREGLQMPREQWPEARDGGPLGESEETLADVLMVLLKLQSARHRVSVGALAGRRDVERVARGERDGLPLLSGWRHELAGRALLDFIEGKTALCMGRQGLALEDKLMGAKASPDKE